jgi:hypothetical protein
LCSIEWALWCIISFHPSNNIDFYFFFIFFKTIHNSFWILSLHLFYIFIIITSFQQGHNVITYFEVFAYIIPWLQWFRGWWFWSCKNSLYCSLFTLLAHLVCTCFNLFYFFKIKKKSWLEKFYFTLNIICGNSMSNIHNDPIRIDKLRSHWYFLFSIDQCIFI